MKTSKWWVIGGMLALAILVLGVVGVWANPVTIDTVPVGNPGNAGDTHGDGYGRVDYTYNIGKYEVTAGQYCEFLNAVADMDTYGLYNTEMWNNSYGCKIQRSGSAGSYTYSVGADWANRPVNYVSWGDAIRFANWLHNGQPTGAQDLTTTEDGAYYLSGATTDAALVAVSREADWKWAITSEDEWYKAAYHKNNGVTGNYFDYPTSSDSTPSNDLIDPDPGNNATFYDSGFTIGSQYYRTEVGAHENSESPYGTFDQGGNVWEWNEAILYGSYRGLRGGSFGDNDYCLHASHRDYYGFPTYESSYIGFRVSQVPEPTTITVGPSGCNYTTIQAAVNAACSGDTSIVGPATYFEDPITIDGKSDITIKSSEGAELTTLRGTIIIRDSSGVTIEGFTISSPTGDGIYLETTDPEVPLSGIVIKDNRIVNCTGSGTNFGNSHYSDVLIEGNDISENGFDGIALTGTSEDVVIRDNEITDNGVLNKRGCGIRLSRTTRVIIEDNVITGNAFANIHPQ